MNAILTLRGKRFGQKSRKGVMGQITIPKNTEISPTHLEDLLVSLKELKDRWHNEQIIKGLLVSVYYNRIVAKSNRISAFFQYKDSAPNETIVGAKFNDDKTKHIITHYISRDILDKTIAISSQIIALFQQSFPNGELTTQAFNDPKTFDDLQYDNYPFKKNTFKQYLKDSCYVEKFDIEKAEKQNLKNL